MAPRGGRDGVDCAASAVTARRSGQDQRRGRRAALQQTAPAEAARHDRGEGLAAAGAGADLGGVLLVTTGTHVSRLLPGGAGSLGGSAADNGLVSRGRQRVDQ